MNFHFLLLSCPRGFWVLAISKSELNEYSFTQIGHLKMQKIQRPHIIVMSIIVSLHILYFYFSSLSNLNRKSNWTKPFHQQLWQSLLLHAILPTDHTVYRQDHRNTKWFRHSGQEIQNLHNVTTLYIYTQKSMNECTCKFSLQISFTVTFLRS
jgi:hypothetical protein